MSLASKCWKDPELAKIVWEARKDDRITEQDSTQKHPVLHIRQDVMQWIDLAINNAIERGLI